MIFDEAKQDRISASGAVAVLTIDDASLAFSLARALLDGGVNCMELTLRTPVALEALREVKSKAPQMMAGVGTILTPEQIDQSVEAGADFGVAPGLNRCVVKQAKHRGLSFAPGAVTPSEIEAAVELGCRLIKFFPAEPAGGLGYLRVLAAPYEHLNLQYIPLGGIGPSNAAEYLDCPLISAIGGSFIASRQQIQKANWSAITQNAEVTRKLIKETRGECSVSAP